MDGDTTLFARFGTALAIGLLIGMQREHVREPGQKLFAGARTFALLGLAGCLAAAVADQAGGVAVFAALTGVLGALIVAGYVFQAIAGEIGGTTEVAAVVAVAIGALCYQGELAVAAAVGVATTVVLSIKIEAHALAKRLTREDVEAILKFAVITTIVLPVLPDREFGPPPLDVLNPYQIWLMVVLISGISFLGYVLMKWLGARRGIGLTGLLGGLASSTAVTASFSQRSREREGAARALALGIAMAWTMMYARVAIEVLAINPALLARLAAPLAAAAAGGLAWTVYLYRWRAPGEEQAIGLANPFELRPAITFAALFVAILLGARAAQAWLGTAGLFASSVVAGVADVDAITLSVARLSRLGDIDTATAARAIILAVMSNTVVKGAIVMAVGAPALRRAVLPGLALLLALGLGVGWWG